MMITSDTPGWISYAALQQQEKEITESLGQVIFTTSLINLVMEYAILGPQGRYWLNALEALNCVPEQIPTLPSNIYELLLSKCPIHGHDYIIEETHVFYLLPPGNISKFSLQNPTILKILSRVQLTALRALFYGENGAEISTWETPKWVLVPKTLLPHSVNKTYHQQRAMIEALNKTAPFKYEVPRFRDAFTVAILDVLNHEDSRLWICGDRGETRVEETTTSSLFNNTARDNWNITVGMYNPGQGPSTPYIEETHREIEYPSVGIVPICTDFTPKPPPQLRSMPTHPFCTLV